MAKPLKEDKSLSVKPYHCWKFRNPKGANVRCEAIKGAGEISLYKNNTKIGLPYKISSEPGHPTAVHLSTGNWDSPKTITVQDGDTLLKIARQFGVSVDSLVTLNGIKNPDVIISGQQLKIPDSEWEIWITELGSEESKFKVELLSQ